MSLLPLLDVFRRYREKATGVWKLGQDPCRIIFFDSGDIVFAQSTHPLDKLTHLLVERGKLTQAQLDYAMANLKQGFSIGKNLIDMGFITQRDLLDVARAQVERIVWGALGTIAEAPAFQDKVLETNIVRLPMDTPLLLLNAILNFQDRERLLELLGPLNQVVVLQTKRLIEMSLPTDLAKLPPHLDGTHTLRELSQQGFAEPLRLGAFVLFLREIGWARLHEMPPMDRQVLDRALAPEPEPLSPPLPEAPIETIPSLFSTIEAAAKPTTNLEHLSQALDHSEPPDRLPDPQEESWPRPTPPLPIAIPTASDPYDFKVQTGQALLPGSSTELPTVPEKPEGGSGSEPSIKIHPATLAPFGAVPPRPAPEFQEPTPRRSKHLLPLLVLLVIVAGLAGGYWWKKHRVPSKGTMPLPVETTATKQPEKVEAKVPIPTVDPVVTEAPKPKEPEAKTEDIPFSSSLESRLATLQKRDLELALRQGPAHAKEIKARHWVLRLEIACEGDTVWHALELFTEPKPDLFLVPIALRDGRPCYQVFYGDFPSQAAAEKHVRKLPEAFRAEGNRPKPYLVSEIPSQQ